MLFAEVSAIMASLRAAGFNVQLPVVVESDNLMVVRLLTREEDVLTLVKSMVEELLSLRMHYRI